MESFLIKALQLILCLSIIVIVHEFGHFLFARLFKMRVEKFYLFFDPWFSLFKFKPKGSDTEYGIGWLPLGGYVKISGMMDESMDKDQLAQEPKPWEFRTKPAWQRLLVMAGGVLFNFVLSIFVLSMMMFYWGDSYVPYKNIPDGMEFSAMMKSAGFRDRDKLISADGKDLNMRGGVLEMNTLVSLLDAERVIVERNGEMVTLVLPDNFMADVVATRDQPYNIWRPTVIDSVAMVGEASEVGLMGGDSIVAVNNVGVSSFDRLKIELNKNANKEISLTFYRNGEEQTVTVALDSTATLGFYAKPPRIFRIQTDEYGFLESFPMGVTKGVETLKGYVGQSKLIFSKEGVRNLGGFGAIGSMFPAEWDWEYFWTMVAFLSIAIGFLNIMPIPVLDGGHIMFLLYEVIARRKPNEKFVEYAQIGGMILLFGLLLVANGNDIIRAIF